MIEVAISICLIYGLIDPRTLLIQAAKIRAAKRPVGWEHFVEAHENVAHAYEQEARKRAHAESGMQPKRAQPSPRHLGAFGHRVDC